MSFLLMCHPKKVNVIVVYAAVVRTAIVTANSIVKNVIVANSAVVGTVVVTAIPIAVNFALINVVVVSSLALLLSLTSK